MDPNRHVNNVAIARYFEEGRAAFVREMLRAVNPPLGGRRILVNIAIQFLQEGKYPGEVEIGSAVSGIGRVSYQIRQHLFQDGQCIADSTSVYVFVENGVKTALPDSFKSLLVSRLTPAE
jgi:acyl-CoA thioester hydrolase